MHESLEMHQQVHQKRARSTKDDLILNRFIIFGRLNTKPCF